MATVVERYIIGVELKGGKKVVRDLNQIKGSANSGRKALAFLRAGLVVVASAAIIGRILQTADSLRELNNRLRLVTSSQAELVAVQRSLFKVSQETRTSLEGNVILFQRLAEATSGTGRTYEELIGLTRTIAVATAISGSTAQQASAGLRQFAQAIAAGALQGDELTSVVENLPRLAQIIGKEFKVSAGALKVMNRQTPGLLTIPRILKAIETEAARLEEQLESTSITIGQGFQILSNAAVFFIGNLSDTTGAGKAMAEGMVSLAANIDKVFIALVAFTGLALFNLLLGQIGAMIRGIAALGLASTTTFGIMKVSVLALLTPLRLMAPLFLVLGGAAATSVAFLATGIKFLTLEYIAFAPWAVFYYAALAKQALITKVAAAWTAILATATRAWTAVTALASTVAAAYRTALTLAAAGMVLLRTASIGTRISLVLLTISTAAGAVAMGVVRLATLSWAAALAVLRGGLLATRAVLLTFAAAAALSMAPFLIGIAIFVGLALVIYAFRDSISAALERMGGFTNIFNVIVSSAIAFFRVLFTNFDLFKRAAEEIRQDVSNTLSRAFQAMRNAGVSAFNGMIDAIQGIANAFISARNKASDFLNLLAPEKWEIPPITEIDLSNLKGEIDETVFVNTVRGAGALLAGTITGEFEKEMADGGPAKVIADNVDKAKKLFKSFTSTGLSINRADLQGTPDFLGGAGDGAKKLSKEAVSAKKALDSLLGSISPLAAANAKWAKALKTVNDAIKEGVIAGADDAKTKELMAKVTNRLWREISGVGNATTDYNEKLEVLKIALDKGAISMEEMVDQSRDLKIELLGLDKTAAAGFQRGVLEASKMFEDLASLAEKTMTNAFKNIEDGLVSLIRTGNANFSELINGIADDITGLFVRSQITGPLARLLGLEEGGDSKTAGLFDSAGSEGGIFGAIGGLLGNPLGIFGGKEDDKKEGGIGGVVAGVLGGDDDKCGCTLDGGPAGDILNRVFDDKTPALGESIEGAMGTAGEGLFAGLGESFGGLLDGMGGIFSGLLGGLSSALSGILGGVGSGIGGIGGAVLNLAGAVFGFANGGAFNVGGQGGTDSELVAFRATPNERVTIETPRQVAAREGVGATRLQQTVVNNNWTIVTPDAQSFARNKGQLEARADSVRERVARRNR
jgi:tape measure domain-containing protein